MQYVYFYVLKFFFLLSDELLKDVKLMRKILEQFRMITYDSTNYLPLFLHWTMRLVMLGKSGFGNMGWMFALSSFMVQLMQ